MGVPKPVGGQRWQAEPVDQPAKLSRDPGGVERLAGLLGEHQPAVGPGVAPCGAFLLVALLVEAQFADGRGIEGDAATAGLGLGQWHDGRDAIEQDPGPGDGEVTVVEVAPLLGVAVAPATAGRRARPVNRARRTVR
jgi:hypothetical protein